MLCQIDESQDNSSLHLKEEEHLPVNVMKTTTLYDIPQF